MVTGRRKLIEMSIKGLPVIIPPSCAHLVDEGSVSYNDSSINRLEWSNTLEEWSKSQIFTCIQVASAQGGIVGNCGKKQQVRVSFLGLSICFRSSDCTLS